MLGRAPRALSDVVELHPRDGWGNASYYTVHLPGGGERGHYASRSEAFAAARVDWPALRDNEDE